MTHLWSFLPAYLPSCLPAFGPSWYTLIPSFMVSHEPLVRFMGNSHKVITECTSKPHFHLESAQFYIVAIAKMAIVSQFHIELNLSVAVAKGHPSLNIITSHKSSHHYTNKLHHCSLVISLNFWLQIIQVH